MKTSKEMLVMIGTGSGFQHLIDSHFWYLPFVRQCKYVMEQFRIPEDEWMAKRAVLPWLKNTTRRRPAHATCSRMASRLQFKLAGLQTVTDLFKQRRGKLVVLLKSTQAMVLPD